IFDTPAEVPLYEFIGLSMPLDDDDLQCSGDYNRYADDDVIFLRIRKGGLGEGSQDFPLRRPWSNEKNHQPGIPWQCTRELPAPAHALKKTDFAIDGAIDRTGCDLALLPDVAPPTGEYSQR